MVFIGNLLWFAFGGIWLALGSAILGIPHCIAIIGIPWGARLLNIAQAGFAPLGKKVVSK